MTLESGQQLRTLTRDASQLAKIGELRGVGSYVTLAEQPDAFSQLRARDNQWWVLITSSVAVVASHRDAARIEYRLRRHSIIGEMRDPVVREFLLAFWKIHILHHADEQGVYGHWMLEELHHHGYRLSPGTLYPMLARMAQRGWLRASEPKRANGPRMYRLTPRGHDVLAQIRHALDELYDEVGAHRPESPRKRVAATKKKQSGRL